LNLNVNHTILCAVIIVVFYTIFILFSDVEKFSSQLIKIDVLFVPLIIAVHVLSLLVCSVRQKVLLDLLDIKLSLRQNILFQFAGYSMSITPGGIGELIKSHFLKKIHSKDYTKTIPVVFAEKYYNMLASALVITVMLFFRNNFEIEVTVAVIWILLIVALVIIRSQKVFPMRKIPQVWVLKNVLESVSSFSKTLVTLSEKKIFIKCFFLGTVAVLADAVAIYLCFLAFNINYNFIDSTLFVITSLTVGAISFLPGGIGVTELSMTALLVKSGIIFSAALALTIFIRFMITWSTVVIGFIALRFTMKSKSST
ncbi:MAG: lysylphosphatidylglycerol synthase transmembrane domain-containing protein, partial [Nitrosotalea sp.]